jgi:hypothetical protein
VGDPELDPVRATQIEHPNGGVPHGNFVPIPNEDRRLPIGNYCSDRGDFTRRTGAPANLIPYVTIPLLHTKHHTNPVFDYIREERISLEGSSSRGRERNKIRNRSSVHFGGQSTKQTNTRLWTKYSLALRPVGKTAWIG